MAYVLAALGVILASLLVAVVLLLVLPVRVRGSVRVRATELLEGVLDDGARLEVRMAGSGDQAPDPDADETACVEVAYTVSAALLGGFFRFDLESGTRMRGRILWWRLGHGGGKAEPAKSDSARREAHGLRPGGERANGPKPGGRRMSVAQAQKYLAPEVRAKAIGALHSLVRSFHLSGTLDLELGLPDSGSTGMAYAAWMAAGGANWTAVRFHPHFGSECVDLFGEGGLSFVPARVALIVASFMLSRETRPLWMKRLRVRKPSGRTEVALVLRDGGSRAG